MKVCIEERQRWRRGVVETNYGASVDVRLADYGVLIKGAKVGISSLLTHASQFY